MSQVDTRNAADDLHAATQAMDAANATYAQKTADWAEAQRAQREATAALAVAAGNMAWAADRKADANRDYVTAWAADRNARDSF